MSYEDKIKKDTKEYIETENKFRDALIKLLGGGYYYRYLFNL